MLHPLFVSTYFSVIYLLFHIFPSSTAFDLHHYYSTNATTDQIASSQFKSLNTLPLSFLITRPCARFCYTGNILISILILLSGDIQPNPGPVSIKSPLNMCTLNIRSLTNTLHHRPTAHADLAESRNIHVFALTETWLTPNSTSAEIFDAIPPGFTFLSTARPVPDTCTSSVIGGGTAFLIREPCTLLSSPTTTFKSFEMSTVTLKLPHSKLTIFNIYRPPSSLAKSRHTASFSQFLEDFQTLISSISTTPHEFLITGDFNIHVDDLTDSNALKFISLLDLANLTQHVPFSTHCHSHTLDLVITTSDSLLLLPLHPFFHLIIFLSFTLLTFPHHPLYLGIHLSILLVQFILSIPIASFLTLCLLN